jgi:hypothetical protein
MTHPFGDASLHLLLHVLQQQMEAVHGLMAAGGFGGRRAGVPTTFLIDLTKVSCGRRVLDALRGQAAATRAGTRGATSY